MVAISSVISPQTAILRILESVSNNSFFENNNILVNDILLLFKLYIYKSREKKFINMNKLIAEIQKVKRTGKEIALKTQRKQVLLEKKNKKNI